MLSKSVNKRHGFEVLNICMRAGKPLIIRRLSPRVVMNSAPVVFEYAESLQPFPGLRC
jgi:hypothetical protein